MEDWNRSSKRTVEGSLRKIFCRNEHLPPQRQIKKSEAGKMTMSHSDERPCRIFLPSNSARGKMVRMGESNTLLSRYKVDSPNLYYLLTSALASHVSYRGSQIMYIMMFYLPCDF